MTRALSLIAVAVLTLAYSRADWRHWTDQDHNCLDTRHEVLAEESIVPPTIEGCRVTAGQWLDPYSGKLETDPRGLDVDHVVALGAAAASGGEAWSPERKRLYANDLLDPNHLVATAARLNRQKGARGPDEWLPPLESARGWYVRTWLAIKERWALTLTAPECRAVCEEWAR